MKRFSTREIRPGFVVNAFEYALLLWNQRTENVWCARIIDKRGKEVLYLTFVAHHAEEAKLRVLEVAKELGALKSLKDSLSPAERLADCWQCVSVSESFIRNWSAMDSKN